MEAVINKIELNSKEKIISYLRSTTKELVESLSSFSDQQINISTDDGRWTAGQVTEHILKSESGLSKLLTGKTGPTDRRPDEKNDMIETAFLDFSVKMKSPEFIIPSDGPHNKVSLLQSFSSHRHQLIELVSDMDLSPTCYGFSLPGMGEFTRMEWLCFIICHSTRHIRQLNNIRKSIND